MMRWSGCLALLLALTFVPQAATAADAPAPIIHMTEPRSFGHFVGDTFERIAEIEVAGDEQFVAAALPQPGQLAYWLELRKAETATVRRGASRRLHLKLDYQLFYVPIDTRKLKIPAINVELKGSTGTRLATIPAFIFLISPVREIYPERSGETTATFLKDDAKSEHLKTAPIRTSALLAAIAAALSFILLAFHRAWWPFHRRPGRPFTEAERVVTDRRQSYASALISLHRAFDQSQGERLLAGDLDSFFDRRPEQAGQREIAKRFFTASQTFFFAGDSVAAESSLPRSTLERFAGDLANNERAER